MVYLNLTCIYIYIYIYIQLSIVTITNNNKLRYIFIHYVWVLLFSSNLTQNNKTIKMTTQVVKERKPASGVDSETKKPAQKNENKKSIKKNKKQKSKPKSEFEQFYTSAFGKKVIGITLLFCIVSGSLFAYYFQNIKNFYIGFYGPLLMDAYARYYHNSNLDSWQKKLNGEQAHKENEQNTFKDSIGRLLNNFDPKKPEEMLQPFRDLLKDNAPLVTQYLGQGLSMAGVGADCAVPLQELVLEIPAYMVSDKPATKLQKALCNKKNFPENCMETVYTKLRSSLSMVS